MSDIHCNITIHRVVFYNSDSFYCILSCEITDYYEDSINMSDGRYGYHTFVGVLPDPVDGEEYQVWATLDEHPKYGKQYKITKYKHKHELHTPEGRKAYMSLILPKGLYKAAYDLYDDPFELFENNDLVKLVQIKGLGIHNIHTYIDRFNRKRDDYSIYAELASLNLTDSMIRRMMQTYKSQELIIKIINTNPYAMIGEVKGISWKRADMIAMRKGMKPDSPERIQTFIMYYLDQQAKEGDSYIDVAELGGAIEEHLPDVGGLAITENLQDLDQKNMIWSNPQHTLIGSMYYYELEMKIAKELLRIQDAVGDFDYGDIETKIRSFQQIREMEFTDEQIEGIRTILNNQVIFITGLAGTGKTTLVSLLLYLLEESKQYALCALAGKAAQRLAEVTGAEGYTIHRLLKYSPQGGFMYNSEIQLPYDIIVVDEVSMIDLSLMHHLLEAIPDGCKLIMLGDVAQLPPIGSGNFANDILQAPQIPTVRLTKIHRQAARSAIITDSISISNGEQIIPKDYKGWQTRGELQDFHMDVFPDATHTFYKVIEHVNNAVEKGVSLHDIQVIVPVKTKGDASVYNLNNTIQEMYNPTSSVELDVNFERKKGMMYTLRLGDKVINEVNNYESQLWQGDSLSLYNDHGEYKTEAVPVFNGNMGVVKQIFPERKMLVIDFDGLGELVIQNDDTSNIRLGYAITAHKAQGSEFDNVIIGLDFNAYTLLSRQWLYTAITRAKKDCILCCQTGALRYAVAQNHIIQKHTHLIDCLHELTTTSW